MKPLKGKIGTILILFFTVILAGVAIFTALRLYQLRQQPVAPNVPSSIPRAQEVTGACALSFTLSTVLQCEPETGGTWCTNAGATTATVDHDVTTWAECLTWCKQNMTAAAPICQYNGDNPRNCWVKEPPSGGISACTWAKGNQQIGQLYYPMGSCYQASTPTPTATPEGTATPGVPTATPNSCGGTCGSDANCDTSKDLYCNTSVGFCRHKNCPTEADCTCPAGSTSTPAGTGAPGTAAPTLPQSGTSWPTVLSAGVGVLVIIGSLLLAL